MDWLQMHMSDDEDVQIKSLTNDQTILVVAGPKARDVLSAVSRRHWKADILTEFDLFETGLDRFVKMDKGDFIGKAALEKRVAAGKTVEFVTMELNTDEAAAHGGSSVMVGDDVVGTVTSGDWGYRVGNNLAYAFVKPAPSAEGTTFEVEVLGKRVPATVISMGPYNPDYSLMRS